MAHETLTVNLPTHVYQQLKARAQQAHHSIEAELLDIVTTAIEEDDLPADITEAMEALKPADDATLWQVAQRSRLSNQEEDEIEQYHFKRQRGERLSDEEEERLAALMHDSHRAMLLRAQAAALLKGRGHDVDVLLQHP